MGLDGARFWELTPRQIAVEMDGAADRMRMQRSLVWWGAMLPHMKQPPKHDEFAGIRRRGLADCIAAWERVRRAMERGR
jgi:hypothetical protein